MDLSVENCSGYRERLRQPGSHSSHSIPTEWTAGLFFQRSVSFSSVTTLHYYSYSFFLGVRGVATAQIEKAIIKINK